LAQLRFPARKESHVPVDALGVGRVGQSSEDYAKYARDTFARERALIERLGLLAK
jgi:hypothetical protein